VPLPHARLLAKALWVQIEDLMPPAGAALAANASQAAPPTNVAPPAPSTPRVESTPLADAGQSQSSQSGQTREEYAPASRPTNRPESPARNVPRQSAQGGSQQGKPPMRERHPSAPPAPLSEGQMQELIHLASRLEVTREQLEGRIGKTLDALSRVEAKDWVKRLRAMADELAPSARMRYGRWPEAQEDREAAYLAEQCESGATFTFKLFNGEALTGIITDFTLYTLTIKSVEGSEETVVRKLAIAYYRKVSDGNANTNREKSPPSTGNNEQAHDHERDDARQPLDKGIDSDRAGQPDKPERDNMDEDRGL